MRSRWPIITLLFFIASYDSVRVRADTCQFSCLLLSSRERGKTLLTHDLYQDFSYPAIVVTSKSKIKSHSIKWEGNWKQYPWTLQKTTRRNSTKEHCGAHSWRIKHLDNKISFKQGRSLANHFHIPLTSLFRAFWFLLANHYKWQETDARI